MASVTTPANAGLMPEQSTALLDVLTHRQTYSEIEAFKSPRAIQTYGPPFQDDRSTSSSPVLQTLLSKFILKLPGLRDVSPEFWKVQIGDLLQELAQAELSESYDKGVLGIRKTLATAISALIEYPTRGCLGAFPKQDWSRAKQYDTAEPEDVLQAWQDCMQAVIYGNLLDELFEKAAETDDLKQHDTLVQGMHEFVLVNIASLMHYMLVVSPEGPTLLRMIENVHRLLPYAMMRQTLKIGNVATMISAMMRVILAKVSVASVTNWIGLSSGADEGMNLLQQIISQVLQWDKRELKTRTEKLEKAKDGPPKAVRDALRNWIEKSKREEHEECRRMSEAQQMSIVAVILNLSSGPSADDLTKEQHEKSLEWFSLQLAIRDRQEIVRVLCQRNPDHLTAAINDGVAAYTPMIRQVHQAVDLSDTLWDLERFVTDMLKMAKPTATPKDGMKTPSVEDFVDLLHRHAGSTHKFLHQVAKNGKEVTGWWHDYTHMAAAQFRANEKPPPSEAVVPDAMANGGAQQAIVDAFAKLPDTDKSAVKSELGAHHAYLEALHAASASRIADVIKRTQTTTFGPGAYLARWQDLLDSTPITPATAQGAVRHGATRSVKEEGRKDIDGKQAGFVSEQELEKKVDQSVPAAPEARRTLELLGPKFREALASGSG